MANSLVRRLLGDSRSRYHLFSALLLVSVTLLSGCKPAITDPKDPKFIVAEKGDWKITRAELDTEVASFLKQHQATEAQVGPAKMPMVETMMLKNMVLKKLMLEKAATLQLKDVDKDEAAQMDGIKQSLPPGQDLDAQLKTAGMTMDDLKAKIHEQVIIHKVLEADAFKNVDPTEQQIDDIYNKNKDSFNIPAKVRASRVLILVDDKTTPADKAAKKKAIDAAHARVVKGEDFGKVATEVSQDQYSKPKGGDLGFFSKGENPDAGFDDVAFNTKEGVVSPVFETSLGYQFLKVTDIKPGGQVSLAEARPQIAEALRQDQMGKAADAYAQKLRAERGVTYHIAPFDPQAALPPETPSATAPHSPPPATNAAGTAPR